MNERKFLRRDRGFPPEKNFAMENTTLFEGSSLANKSSVRIHDLTVKRPLMTWCRS